MSIKIPLSRGLSALVDDVDADLATLAWYAHRGGADCGTWYPVRHHREGARSSTLSMHRAIWARMHPGEPQPKHVDHRNGDGLDCRRENLRAATKAQNEHNKGLTTLNTSGFKGVKWFPSGRCWRAQIRANGQRLSLGLFDTAEAAARAYDEAARIHHGEFACVNFPRDGERGARRAA